MLKALAVVALMAAAWAVVVSFSNARGADGARLPSPEHRFDRPPEPLDSLRDVRPRLHLTAGRVDELRLLVRDDPDHARMFETVRTIADRGVKDGPPAYTARGDAEWDEQLWQRGVGSMMPHLAMAYLMTGEARYLDAARAWMIASALYPTWGRGIFEGKDLAAGHQLYGMACAYDWLYHALDAETRAAIRDTLVTRGWVEYDAIINKRIYWTETPLQNHMHVSITGLAAAGFALYGEAPEAESYILAPLALYREVFAALADDGASMEGVPYWTYGMEYMLKFMDLADGLLGLDFFPDNPWYENSAYFRLYSSLPRKHWSRSSSLMTYGDGPRFDWYGPDYLLRKVAARYRNPHAQWLASEAELSGICGLVEPWLNLAWYDPSVPAAGPETLPTLRHFDDLDLVLMRSDWSGDEAVSAFKCGPHIGHHALANYDRDLGSSHNHPDAGAFQIFAHGDWLIVDDGYTWKETMYQNTALVNGVGQAGDGRQWFQGWTIMADKRGARIAHIESSPDMDIMVGDVTGAYRKEAGLARFTRSFYYLRPSTWLIVDEFEAEEPSTFELYFHGEYPFEAQGSRLFSMMGKTGGLVMTTVVPEDAEAEVFEQELKSTGGAIMSRKLQTVKISNAQKSRRAVFVHALAAFPVGAAERLAATVGETGGVKTLRVMAGGRQWSFRMDLDRQDFSTPPLVREGN